MELEMKTEGKKLEFYTGRWVSFLPFIIFLGMIIVSVVLDAVSERSMWICCIVGLMIAFFLAKDKSSCTSFSGRKCCCDCSKSCSG